ncbi:hypothetical protein H704_00935 [Bartonella bacilliformis Peru38]|uniref:DUF6460 domain-containing protein n=1 Tax=Bartonella bacilliformis TaxID=774 RepID=UPI00049F6A7E|nr:DUF6460 domain-containing protein [Bartonella bacilliformis]KEG17083.1 hypothetical protein H705_00976 [Bartonella bacilliformis Cond044]KEG20286.1 hypothetical protein H704_00935 [Bartonella bacilliformis Peru38]
MHKNLFNSLHSFLGDTPGRVTFKLLIFSVLVGIVMSLFGWTPVKFIEGIIKYLQALWNAGFITFINLVHLAATGAVIVVPVFLISRILSRK